MVRVAQTKQRNRFPPAGFNEGHNHQRAVKNNKFHVIFVQKASKRESWETILYMKKVMG